jgi:hypothetical protein
LVFNVAAVDFPLFFHSGFQKPIDFKRFFAVRSAFRARAGLQISRFVV